MRPYVQVAEQHGVGHGQPQQQPSTTEPAGAALSWSHAATALVVLHLAAPPAPPSSTPSASSTSSSMERLVRHVDSSTSSGRQSRRILLPSPLRGSSWERRHYGDLRAQLYMGYKSPPQLTYVTISNSVYMLCSSASSMMISIPRLFN
jgi:hypothetical protein